jgi:hypothetical protein
LTGVDVAPVDHSAEIAEVSVPQKESLYGRVVVSVRYAVCSKGQTVMEAVQVDSEAAIVAAEADDQ